MERYNLKIKDEIFIRGLEVELTNMRSGFTDQVKGPIYLYEDELYSFIYINDRDKLGSKGEIIVRGKITKIEKQVVRKNRMLVSDYIKTTPSQRSAGGPQDFKLENLYTIWVDCSSEYGSKTVKLDLSRILDIGPIDQDWLMEDESELIPRIPELTIWGEKPKVSDKEDTYYISKEYDRPHPSIK